LDALIIACATRDHVNLLNNQSAKSENTRYDLQHKLRNKEKWVDNNGKERLKFTSFHLPWPNFAKEAKNGLERIVVSFKHTFCVCIKVKIIGKTDWNPVGKLI
jgi:CRISPR-associated endonuclease Csn1